LFINLAPIIVFFIIWLWISRRAVGRGMNGPMSMGKSKAKLLDPEEIKITFEDVAGVDEAKEDLQEVVEFLEDPHKFERLGGKIPRGVLLVGPPGTGKTLLARAIAGESGVNFIFCSGSDFDEMYAGVGAKRVR
jgi:cell division protease FtsH